jgi:Uma2 family endonuclease
MATIAPPPPISPLPPPAVVYRLTVDQYDRMLEQGVVAEDEAVELVGGILVKKMPKNSRYAAITGWLGERLAGMVPAGWHVRKEDPVRIPDYDEPEPDLAVARGAFLDYLGRHPGPGDVALIVIVEVAESSLATDRRDKRTAYEKAGVSQYWIVNLIDRQVEVYAISANGYSQPLILRAGDQVPVVVDGQQVGQVAVSDLIR